MSSDDLLDSSVIIKNCKCSNALEDYGILMESYGCSSFHCRLLSNLFTSYRFNPTRGTVERFYSESGEETIFDCSLLSGYSFKIKPEQLENAEYEIDKSAMDYLKGTLESIKCFNNAEKYPIVPLNATGDGYCLMHAISRGLVGRELFWHPLLSSLKKNMQTNVKVYQDLLKSFFSLEDIDQYIRETFLDYQSDEDNGLGFTCFHIFVLSQVLRRPILLLDADMTANIEYTGLFLPVLQDPDECCDKTGEKNPPLLIAWSSSARNHFVPLVGVDGSPCVIPYNILPRTWGPNGIDSEYLYLTFDEDSSISFGLGKQIKETYLDKLIEQMENKFKEINGLTPKLVTSFYYKIKQENSCRLFSVKYQELIAKVLGMVDEMRLLKCMNCGRLHSRNRQDESVVTMPNREEQLFQLCVARLLKDILEMTVLLEKEYYRCNSCQGSLRVVKADGDVIHINGDRVKLSNATDDDNEMIYWNGQLYDNKPEMIEFQFSHDGNTYTEQIAWFHKEREACRNSNAYEKAQEIIEKYELTAFGDNALKACIAQRIIDQTLHLKDCDVIGMGENVQSNVTLSPQSTNEKKLRNESKPKCNAVNGYLNQKKPQRENQNLGKRQDGATNVISQPTLASDRGNAAREMAISPIDKAPQKFRKILLKYNDKNVKINVKSSMTYEELQNEIEINFNIKAHDQIIKVGYPRKTLERPKEADQPIGLVEGEAVIIDKRNCTALCEEKFNQDKVVQGEKGEEK